MEQYCPKIVIVGGGASGLNLATRLSKKLGRKKRADITLVDENLSHIWKPSLHEFAAGTKGPEEEISFLEHSNRYGYNFRLGHFAGVDLETRRVLLDPVKTDTNVELSPERQIPYDFLVLAIGSHSNDFGTPGVTEHCLFLDTPTQAKRLQSEILNLCLRLETGALVAENNSVGIAIVGGGATGVELAAELREATEQLGRNGIDKLRIPQSVRIDVIEGADRLLSALPENISERVLTELNSQDIGVKLNARVTQVTPKTLHMSDGSSLEAEIIVWAAGIKSKTNMSETELETGSLGRLSVQPTLQSTKHKEVFVIGDAADCFWSEKNCSLPPRAQVAAQQAQFMMGQIQRVLESKPLQEFKYTDHGSLVALSSRTAVGALMGRAFGTMTIKGWLARRAYKYLHFQHEATVQGHWRAGLRSILTFAMRRIRPRLKLH